MSTHGPAGSARAQPAGPVNSFAQFAQLWLESTDVSAATQAQYHKSIKRYWLPAFGDIDITTIRYLPSDYGDWKNTHRRFCRWRDNGTWEVLLEQLIDLPDFEWLLVDVAYFSPHSQEESTRDNKKTTEQGKKRKKYLWPWMRLICGSEFLLRTVPKRIAPDRSID